MNIRAAFASFGLVAMIGAGVACGEILGLDDYSRIEDPTPRCGDGKLDSGEICDDGNDVSADGCSDCSVDDCYTCSTKVSQASVCSLAAAGTGCSNTRVCDGKGGCVECVNDTQCLDGYCYENACLSCTDGIKNGDEADVDCGGAHCGKCDDAKTCLVATDCKSGFCVDGVCCVDACDQVCAACNVAGSEGLCDFIGKYAEDLSFGMGQSCTMAMGKVCNGGGGCGLVIGAACQSPGNCASLKCADPDGDGNNTCVKNTGDACTANVECFNNMCDPGTMKCL